MFFFFPHWLQLGIYSNEPVLLWNSALVAVLHKLFLIPPKRVTFTFNLYFMDPLRQYRDEIRARALASNSWGPVPIAICTVCVTLTHPTSIFSPAK